MSSADQPRQQQPRAANDPGHVYPSEILASFAPGTFLENIAVDDQGILHVTSLEEGLIYSITPAGTIGVLGNTNGKPAGICQLNDGFLINGWDQSGVPTIYAMDPSGKIKPLHQPPYAQFLNGMVPLTNTQVLVCDAYNGCILLYDVTTNDSFTWLEHPLLSKTDMQQEFMPSANGIKIYDGMVYVSNTERQLLLQIPVIGEHPGEPIIFLDKVNLDDFAIDASGTIYASTHIHNSVVKITPDKQVSTIAGVEAGLAGSTAVAFGRQAADRDHLYVTTNGGMSLPYEGVVQNARVVKIKFR